MHACIYQAPPFALKPFADSNASFQVLYTLSCLAFWCLPILILFQSTLRRKRPVQLRGYPTFWREDQLTLQASSSQRVEDGVLAMGFHGNASAVYGATYLSGTSPGSGSTNECSVSDTLAWALWGSQDVIGQTLTFETADKQSCTYLSISQCPMQTKSPALVSPSRKPPMPANISIQ